MLSKGRRGFFAQKAAPFRYDFFAVFFVPVFFFAAAGRFVAAFLPAEFAAAFVPVFGAAFFTAAFFVAAFFAATLLPTVSDREPSSASALSLRRRKRSNSLLMG